MPSHAQTHFRVRLLAATESALVFAPLAHAQANPTLTIDTPGPGGMAHVVTATDNMGVTVTGAGIANIGGGGRVSIDGRTPMSYVRTTNGGTSFISEINISGTGGISQNSALASAMYGSTVTLIDSSIRNSGDVAFWAARGNMDMNVPGSTVHMDNVILEGNGRALVVGGDSTVDVRNSHIEATRRDGARMNYAVQVTDSQFTAVDTTISGSDAAVKITTESRPQRAGSTVVLDNARLIAEGAGIRIERGVLSAPGDFMIDVDIRNGTTIKADSGTLLSVTSVPNALTPYHVNVNVDNSVLEGDMMFHPEHVTNEPIDTRLRLDNNAILTGRIDGLAHLHVNNDAEWRLVDNQVLAGEVIMGGGVIDLRHGEAPGQFRTLEIATLAGEGTRMVCPGNTPGYQCSGVLIRVTGSGPTFRSWNPSPAAVRDGAVSWSYVRRDMNMTATAGTGPGLLLHELQYPSAYTPQWRCAYAVNGSTSGTPGRCTRPGALPATAAGFQAFVTARQSIRGPHNEIILPAWPQNIPDDLPLQGIFYTVDTSRSGAQSIQQDYMGTTGHFMPVLSVRLTMAPGAIFRFVPAEQTGATSTTAIGN